jgi:hypothetical protein
MADITLRRRVSILTYMIIGSLATLLIAGGVSLVAAQVADTVRGEAREKRTVEIEISEQGIILRDSEDKEGKEAKIGVIIDDEKITVGGKEIDLQHLDTTMRCIAEGGSIIRFGEDITIEENECVDGDLVAFGADITVRGLVAGDVAVIGGDLHLEATGVIKGDVATVGGQIHQEPGSEIRGQRVGVGPVVPIFIPIRLSYFSSRHALPSFVSFGIPLIVMISFSLLVVALVAFFAPRSVQRIQEAIQLAPLKSFLLGFLAIILFLPLFIILLITIIGIPVALIIQPIAYSLASIMGFAGVSLFVGARLDRSSGLKLPTPLAKMLVGALAIELAFILAWVFTLGGSILAPLFGLFIFIGCTILFVASMAGLGATAWTRFGRRSVVAAMAPTPQVPPPSPPETVEDNKPPEEPAVE